MFVGQDIFIFIKKILTSSLHAVADKNHWRNMWIIIKCTTRSDITYKMNLHSGRLDFSVDFKMFF